MAFSLCFQSHIVSWGTFFGENSIQLHIKQYIIVIKMAKNVSHSAWQALEGDGGNLGAREI